MYTPVLSPPMAFQSQALSIYILILSLATISRSQIASESSELAPGTLTSTSGPALVPLLPTPAPQLTLTATTFSDSSTTVNIASLTAKAFRPLTTLFVPPNSCSNGEWTLFPADGALTSIIQYDVNAQSFLSDCYPPSAYGLDTSYSPGMCPSRFTTAYTTVIDESITSAQCCPTNYEGFGYDGHAGYCYSSYTSFTAVACPGSTATVSATCLAGPGVALTLAVFLLYEETDLSLFPTDYTPGGVGIINSTIVETSTYSDTSTWLPTRSSATVSKPTGTQSPNALGLSTGAKAGIGVGVSLGVLFLILGSILLCCYRRRQRKNQANDDFGSDLPEAVMTKNDRSSTPVVLKKFNRNHDNQDPGLDATILSLDQNSSNANELARSGGIHPYDEPVAYQHSSTSPTSNEQSAPQAGNYGHPEAQSGFKTRSVGVGVQPQQSSFPQMQNSDHHDVPSRLDHTHAYPGAEPRNHLQELPYSSSPERARSPTETQFNVSELGKPKEEMTAADWELRYLESEERRIRERKEALLRSQSP